MSQNKGGVGEGELNGLAVVAFASSFFCALPGIIFGHVALREVARARQRGRGWAIAALVIGYGSIIGWIVVLVVGMNAAHSSGFDSASTTTYTPTYTPPYTPPADTTTDTPTPSPSVAPPVTDGHSGTFNVVASTGDALSVTINFSKPIPLSQAPGEVSDCASSDTNFNADRTMAVYFTSSVELTSSLAYTADVTYSLSGGASNDSGIRTGMLVDYTDGSNSCSKSSNNQSADVKWNDPLQPNGSVRASGWIYLENIISPNAPQGDFASVASLAMAVGTNGFDHGTASGDALIDCGYNSDGLRVLDPVSSDCTQVPRLVFGNGQSSSWGKPSTN